MVALPICEIRLKAKRPKPKAYPKQCLTLGDHLRAVRLDRKFSLPEVAGILGVSTDTVTCWELNRNAPQVHHMPRIIAFLGYLPEEETSDDLSLGTRVRTYRIAKGLTQKKLARELGLDPTTLSQIERDLRKRLNHTTKAMLRSIPC